MWLFTDVFGLMCLADVIRYLFPRAAYFLKT
jgi:hypothetical protein